MNFLNLIRYKNLLIIVATMLIIRYGLLLPMLTHNFRIIDVTFELQLSILNFILLVLATVFISASGYIINDYFDVNADMLNKPDKVVIGKYINRRVAMTLHWVFNLLGVICGGIVSYSIGHFNFIMIFIFISGLLWFYSTTFSKDPIIGNIIIAVLVAFVPLIEGIYELIPLNFMYKNILISSLNFEGLLFWTLGYSLFAFLITLVREMVKDVEDLEGDAAYGRNTLPIAFGIRVAKVVTISVFVISIFSLGIVQIAYLEDMYSIIYMNVGIILPLLISLILFIVSDSTAAYHRVSTILKYVMIIGLLYIVCKNLMF